MMKSMNLCSRFQLEKRQCSSRGSLPEDRISALSDDILLHILSFLTFKEVARTSIISRRWVELWVHSQVLSFMAPVSNVVRVNEIDRQSYVNWVNSVLRLHKGHYLKEFRIFCFLGKHNWKDVDNWLEYALARNVQNLELNFLVLGLYKYISDDNYVFPETLLNFSHEKAIRAVNSNSCLPKLDFKSLKSLSLKGVVVTSDAINFFLLNCPYLDRLEVVGSKKLVNLVISYPTLVLKYLQITDCCNLEVLNISNFNLVSLYITTGGDLTLTNLPMLVELSISGVSDKLSHCFFQASSCHSQLEALTLETDKLKDIIQLSLSLSNLTQMTKLKRLSIKFGVWYDESLTKLFSLTNSCPRLMEFVLMLNWYGPKRTSRAFCKGEQCSLKCLKVFEFIGYFGRVSDMELVLQVAENAVGLEKLIIDPCAPLPIPELLTDEERETRRVALLQIEDLRESIPSHVDLIMR